MVGTSPGSRGSPVQPCGAPRWLALHGVGSQVRGAGHERAPRLGTREGRELWASWTVARPLADAAGRLWPRVGTLSCLGRRELWALPHRPARPCMPLALALTVCLLPLLPAAPQALTWVSCFGANGCPGVGRLGFLPVLQAGRPCSGTADQTPGPQPLPTRGAKQAGPWPCVLQTGMGSHPRVCRPKHVLLSCVIKRLKKREAGPRSTYL